MKLKKSIPWSGKCYSKGQWCFLVLTPPVTHNNKTTPGLKVMWIRKEEWHWLQKRWACRDGQNHKRSGAFPEHVGWNWLVLTTFLVKIRGSPQGTSRNIWCPACWERHSWNWRSLWPAGVLSSRQETCRVGQTERRACLKSLKNPSGKPWWEVPQTPCSPQVKST